MKGSLILGTARKKLGDVVFYRNNGEQQARVRVTPKNPKSSRQAAVRAITATVAIAYGWLKLICDHSFEGVEYGQMSQRKFFKLNAAKLLSLYRSSDLYKNSGVAASTIYSFNPKGVDALMPNAYIVSKGSIPAFGDDRYIAPQNVVAGLATFQIDLGDAFGALDAHKRTYRGLAEAMGVPVGCQMTFITDTFIDRTLDGEGFYSYPDVARFVLAPADGNIDKVINLEDFQLLENATLGWTDAHKKLVVNVEAATGPVGMYGVILSQFVDGKWKRSTCEMNVATQAQATSLLRASQTYQPSAPDPQSTKYLNMGDDAPLG